MQIIKTELAEKLELELDVSFTPTLATTHSNGYDVRACIEKELTIYPGECTLVPLGFKLHIGSTFGCFKTDDSETMTYSASGLVLPKSGLGSIKGIVLGNGVGLIDNDYQEEWICAVLNRNIEDKVVITPGMKIAQILIIPTLHDTFQLVDNFIDSTSRNGGFGSTGE
jgi:dUTP pyrophosphatase